MSHIEDYAALRREWSAALAKLTEAAAFLDRTASGLQATDATWRSVWNAAADCRTMAKKLRGET